MSRVKIGKPYTGTHKTTMPIMAMKALGLKPGDIMNVEVVGNSAVFTPVRE